MRIEVVTPEQLDRVLPLIAAYQVFYNGEPETEKNRRYFLSILQNEDSGILFAAADEERVVGFATLYFPLSSVRADRYCLMNDLFTLPEARGQGVGRALIQKCQTYAAARGYGDLVWNTQRENLKAQRLYDAVGAKPTDWRRYSLAIDADFPAPPAPGASHTQRRDLALSKIERSQLWDSIANFSESYYQEVPALPVSPALDPMVLRAFLTEFTFAEPLPAKATLLRVAEALKQNQVHTPHPHYFGLFNPAPSAMGIVADALVATLNPQLAAWSHSPLAVEIERKLIQEFGVQFGWNPEEVDGTFTSGGAEANQTAVICALVRSWPEYVTRGGRALPADPVLYLSIEAHHSFDKVARFQGLGASAVRHVPVTDDLRMDVEALELMIGQDRSRGLIPFMIIGTAGTTGAGVVDPLRELARVAKREKLWFHTDAAWGGAAVLVPELRAQLNGIDESDSITFDAHKWLSVPMGAGMFLTGHGDVLGDAFRLSTSYMPKDANMLGVTDPYTHSTQWSRRHSGLKLFLTLAVAGWDGYRNVLRHQVAMGELLRERLREDRWTIVNQTPLPVVCFADKHRLSTAEQVQGVASNIVASGKAWISTILLNGSTLALRACVTNYRTEAADIEALVSLLNMWRNAVCRS